jgi:hypothetical protein
MSGTFHFRHSERSEESLLGVSVTFAAHRAAIAIETILRFINCFNALSARRERHHFTR